MAHAIFCLLLHARPRSGARAPSHAHCCARAAHDRPQEGLLVLRQRRAQLESEASAGPGRLTRTALGFGDMASSSFLFFETCASGRPYFICAVVKALRARRDARSSRTPPRSAAAGHVPMRARQDAGGARTGPMRSSFSGYWNSSSSSRMRVSSATCARPAAEAPSLGEPFPENNHRHEGARARRSAHSAVDAGGGGTLRGMVSCTMTSASAAIRLRSSSTASTEPEGSGLAAPFLPPRCEDIKQAFPGGTGK